MEIKTVSLIIKAISKMMQQINIPFILFSLVVVSKPFQSLAQSDIYFQWVKESNFGNSDIKTDSKGNIYITGTTKAFEDSIFLSKYNSSGSLIYRFNLSGSYFANHINKIAVDCSENVYIAGFFKGIADFDPSSKIYNLETSDIHSYSYNSFIAKYDLNGNFVFAKDIGRCAVDAIKIDSTKNIYVGGEFFKNIDFDPGNGIFELAPKGRSSDIFLTKYDSMGNFNYAISIGGKDIKNIGDLAVDASGNCYITGFFFGKVDFDPGKKKFKLSSTKNMNNFLAKYDCFGNFIYVIPLPFNNSSDHLGKLALDDSGNIFIRGRFSDSFDFDPKPGKTILINNDWDYFIAKYTSNGEFVFVSKIIAYGNEELHTRGTDMVVDKQGNLFFMLGFSGTLDFDNGTKNHTYTSLGRADIFIAHYDIHGKPVFVKRISDAEIVKGNAVITPSAITIDDNDDIYVIGSFDGNIDFDPGKDFHDLQSPGDKIGFIAKYTTVVNSKTLIDDAELYTVEDFSKLDIDDEPTTLKLLNSSLRMGKKGVVEIYENKNFINTFDIESKKVMTPINYPKGELCNGNIFLVFYDQKEDTIPTNLYFGEFKNGLAEGYGALYENAVGNYFNIKKKGFWEKGKLMQEQEALVIAKSAGEFFDYEKVLGYSQISDITVKLDRINFPKDFFNHKLSNGYYLRTNVTFKEKGIGHWMTLDLYKYDFYKFEEISFNVGDKETVDNYDKLKNNEVWSNWVTKFYDELIMRNPLSGSRTIFFSNGLDVVKEVVLQRFSDSLIKNDDPNIRAFQSAYIEIINRCLSIEKNQFDENDKLAGVWYNPVYDELIYIESSENPVLHALTLNYENLFTPKKSYNEFIVKEVHSLSEKGWSYERGYTYTDEYGHLAFGNEHINVIIKSISKNEIILDNGIRLLRLNAR